jgi:O-antigen/teichoic acid export membrane protein
MKNILIPTNLRRVFSNTSWLVTGQVISMGFGLIVDIITARAVGPKSFGELNYAYSLMIMAAVFTSVGSNTIVVRELSKTPYDYTRIISSGLGLQFLGTFFALVLVFLFTNLFPTSNYYLVMVSSVMLLFQPFIVFRYYFEANLKTRYIAYSQIISSVIVVIGFILLPLIKAPLSFYALLWTFNFGGTGALFYYYYCRETGQTIKSIGTNYDIKYIRYLFINSFPLLISGVAIILHSQVDRIMLMHLLSSVTADTQIGLYSVANKLLNVVVFIPGMIAISLTPILVRSHKTNINKYKSNVLQFMDLMTWCGAILSVFLFLFSKLIVSLLYGNDYIAAVPILKVVSAEGILYAVGIASGRQCTIENLQKWIWTRNLIGVILNIALNTFLIPSYGAIGAAYATVMSLFVSNFLSNFIVKSFRHVFLNQCNSLINGWHRLIRLAFGAYLKSN